MSSGVAAWALTKAGADDAALKARVESYPSAMAFLTVDMRCKAGVMISASHNPYHDNGIKFFGHDGYKLPDEVERNIETLIAAAEHEVAHGRPAVVEFLQGGRQRGPSSRAGDDGAGAVRRRSVHPSTSGGGGRALSGRTVPASGGEP